MSVTDTLTLSYLVTEGEVGNTLTLSFLVLSPEEPGGGGGGGTSDSARRKRLREQLRLEDEILEEALVALALELV